MLFTGKPENLNYESLKPLLLPWNLRQASWKPEALVKAHETLWNIKTVTKSHNILCWETWKLLVSLVKTLAVIQSVKYMSRWRPFVGPVSTVRDTTGNLGQEL